MAAEVMMHARHERMSADDFETASIRSAAPSYVSDAPSYHSTLPPTEALPQYTPPARTGTSTPTGNAYNRPPMVPPANGSTLLYGPGLPPIRDLPPRSRAPQLNEFRIPTWSNINANPTARQLQAVANRRANRPRGNSSANNNSSEVQVQGALRAVLGRLNEQEDERERARSRPLEDPYLVGEEAAARARSARLARENGDEILIREDQRWDWFLGQIQDWDQRRESWRQFEQSRHPHRRW
ncbi:hypothetical protein LQW54_008952 [Pestalotiopsis sp. IQ-011]